MMMMIPSLLMSNSINLQIMLGAKSLPDLSCQSIKKAQG